MELLKSWEKKEENKEKKLTGGDWVQNANEWILW